MLKKNITAQILYMAFKIMQYASLKSNAKNIQIMWYRQFHRILSKELICPSQIKSEAVQISAYADTY